MVKFFFYILFKKKKINNIFDLLWKLPKSYIDRSISSKIKNLRIAENHTVTIIPKKYNFPRVRNLPNRVICFDDTGEMDCIFFPRPFKVDKSDKRYL